MSPPTARVRILLVAGDPSGDVHGSLLVRAIRRLIPDAWCYGVCGPEMKRAGVAQVADSTGLSAIGIASSVPKLPRLYAAMSALRRSMRQTPPSLAILIDFPAFNMRVLAAAAGLGVPTLYYFPPASWKREPSRAAERLASLAAHVATPFPWSAEVIRELGGRATCVGHPVLDRYVDRPSEARARAVLGIPLVATPVAVLPGSRAQEIRYVLPVLLRAVRRASESMPGILPVISCAPTVRRAAVEAVAERIAPGAIVSEDTRAILCACRAALTKSGTITLDAAVCGLPMVVTYAGSWLDWVQYLLLVRGRVRFIAAPNVLLDRAVTPELYAENGGPRRLAAALLRLLEDGPEREACRAGLAEACATLGAPGASDRAAEIAAAMVGEPGAGAPPPEQA